jgi:hypothetical protein
VLVAWTPLARSRRERLLRRVALGAALVATTALLAAALAAEPVDSVAAAAALAAGIAAWFAGRPAKHQPIEIGIDADGCLVMRCAVAPSTDAVHHLQCAYAAPWLITLRNGPKWVAIWPDSLPEHEFRRVWVHIRWGAGRIPAGRPAGSLPGQPR